MNKDRKKEEVLEALQQFIAERDAAQKKRRTNITDQEEALVADWTLTQLHIVATIKAKGRANNTSLSETLKLSKPSITKAVKKLLQHNILVETQHEENRKEVYYVLTEAGEKLAEIHERLHEQARNHYLQILDQFHSAELETITKFLHVITEEIKHR